MEIILPKHICRVKNQNKVYTNLSKFQIIGDWNAANSKKSA